MYTFAHTDAKNVLVSGPRFNLMHNNILIWSAQNYFSWQNLCKQSLKFKPVNDPIFS